MRSTWLNQPVVPILAPLDDLLLDMSADHSMYFYSSGTEVGGCQGAMPCLTASRRPFGEFAEDPASGERDSYVVAVVDS
jgi:hypothetical protein